MGEEVKNRQVVLKEYVTGFPKESDMMVQTTGIKLKLPEDWQDGILVKNLYVSCDPYMRSRMSPARGDSYVASFVPGSPITGYGVAKVLDSKDSKFKTGDLIWGRTRWEEYSLITSTDLFFQIPYKDVPLSYYTGLLGKCK